MRRSVEQWKPRRRPVEILYQPAPKPGVAITNTDARTIIWTRRWIAN